MINKKNVFILIFILALGLRFSGVSYGLPLRLIADEPQFIFASLLMAQEKIFIPPYDRPEFKTLLYNPPYLLYLFFFPFWILKNIFSVWRLVPYFITARLISIAAGMLAVWLTYKTSCWLFPNKKTAAVFATYFLATSILAITLSATARHWSFAMLLGIGGLAVLASPRMSLSQRYLGTAIIAGIGIGINQALSIVTAFAAAWYFIVEKGKFKNLFLTWWFYAGLALLLGLAALSFIIYPSSLIGVSRDQWGYEFSFLGFFGAPFQFLSSLALSEPIFLIFAVIGLAVLWRKNRMLFWFFVSCILGYVYLFYFGYIFLHRYLGILLPFLAILAGFGVSEIWDRKYEFWKRAAMGILLLIPLIVSLQVAYLLYKDDSRAQARKWFEKHTPANSRVIVWANLMRLSSRNDTIADKFLMGAELDPDDQGEFDHPSLLPARTAFFHALNLYNVKNESLYKNLKTYACVRKYDYVIAQESDFQPEQQKNIETLVTKGTALASFGTRDMRYSVTATQFDGPFWGLFRLSAFGPPISIYKLERAMLCAKEVSPRVIHEGSGFVPKDALGGINLTFEKNYNFHVNITVDGPAHIFLATRGEFEKLLAGKRLNDIPHLEDKSVIAVEKGDYVFVIAPKDEGLSYKVRLETDEFFLD